MKRKFTTLMVDNSINIKQKEKKTPLTSNLWTQKKIMTYDIWNPGSALGQAQKQGKVKLVNQIPTLLPLKTGSSMAIQI